MSKQEKIKREELDDNLIEEQSDKGKGSDVGNPKPKAESNETASDELKEELDAVLDEIDATINNAEEFVANFVQKGGQ